jgi:hypothetical protein
MNASALPLLKRQGRVAGNTPLFNVEVKNEWSYAFNA